MDRKLARAGGYASVMWAAASPLGCPAAMCPANDLDAGLPPPPRALPMEGVSGSSFLSKK
jgi:hypothetical protein